MTCTIAAAPTLDPSLERAQFFFDLELAELTMTIPMAAPPTPAAPVAKY